MSFEQSLIFHSSPTLGGLKTASLFTIKFDSEIDLQNDVKIFGEYLKEKDIRIKILRKSADIALIYVYREHMLKDDFNDKLTQKILKQFGYFNLNLSDCIDFLSKRLEEYDEFPHEIGLFLGYPPTDVLGFICHKGKNCNLCGYWKVYGDEKEALIKFAKYDKCKEIYKKLWLEGRDILKLTVKKQVA